MTLAGFYKLGGDIDLYHSCGGRESPIAKKYIKIGVNMSDIPKDIPLLIASSYVRSNFKGRRNDGGPI